MPDPLTADQISALRAAVERIAANPDFGYTDATLTWGFWDDVRTVTDVAPALLSLVEDAARLKEAYQRNGRADRRPAPTV